MIGGNVKAELQRKSVVRNEIGELVECWSTVGTMVGYLDLASGESRYQTYDAKIQESTHVFVCDYVPIDVGIQSRMIIDGVSYDVSLIDNPMNLNRQLEFYLKMVGGR